MKKNFRNFLILLLSISIGSAMLVELCIWLFGAGAVFLLAVVTVAIAGLVVSFSNEPN